LINAAVRLPLFLVLPIESWRLPGLVTEVKVREPPVWVAISLVVLLAATVNFRKALLV